MTSCPDAPRGYRARRDAAGSIAITRRAGATDAATPMATIVSEAWMLTN